jgi:DNA-binding winged helix-turn-helix (wHTH) protein
LVQFDAFRIDRDGRELRENDDVIHLTPKALQLLQLLVDSRPRVLSKEEIDDALWPVTYVEESSLSVLVAEVRKALRDDARRPRYLKTAFGFGYGFIGDAVEETSAAGAIRLRSAGREFVLAAGENIIGRDPDATIRLSADGISRRHARIVVRGNCATIEDLGSKNGTYVDGIRIDRTRELKEGDEIRISREMLVVGRADSSRTTITEIR